VICIQIKYMIIFVDMTEDNILKDEVELKTESLSPGENSSDENSNEDEDLDFYDFLEVVSDKIDNITTQSKSKFT
jgi:hypothetical protein